MNFSVFTPIFKSLLILSIVASPLLSNGQCFSGWSYETPVMISNTNSTQLDSMQVPVYVNTAALISANKMNADGSDIRFVTSLACCVSLNYWIDSGVNTTATKIWVKVPYIAANSNDTIQMIYGNVAATSVSDSTKVFDLYEDFSSPINHFTLACTSGSETATNNAGQMTYSWTTDATWASDSVFSTNHVYTAEANVTAASGNWPGLYWDQTTGNNNGYSMLYGAFGSQNFTIGYGYNYSPFGYCQGENFALSGLTTTNPAGTWSLTWVATGNQQGYMPGYGSVSATDAVVTKDQPMKLVVGGIDGGAGSMTFDWIRVRKYAPVMPVVMLGTETANNNHLNYSATSFCITANDSATATVNPGGGVFSSAPSGLVINAATGTINLATSAAGTYLITYMAASSDTCSITDTATILIHPSPIPVVTITGNVLTVTGTYSTYQWYRNAVMIGSATNSTYTTTQSGSYYVVVTDANGCAGQSNTITHISQGIANLTGISDINIYPNPNNGVFTITGYANTTSNKVEVEVMDVTGRSIYTAVLPASNNRVDVEVQMSSPVTSGMYFLKITADGQNKTLRFVIK